MAKLSDKIILGNLELKNRIVMPPMCQYSVEAEDGTPNEWHYVHYVSRAVGGTGLIIMEMTNVEPDGRITNRCLGLWSDEQIPAYKRIVDECRRYGAKVGVQIAHAGRKATDAAVPVSSSPIPVEPEGWKTPRELTTEEAEAQVELFRQAARRAVEAGFDTIELHGAHGYLIHQFHSPSLNRRTDKYGQDRMLFGCEVIRAVKEVLPEGMPLVMRISAMEYITGGYDLDYGAELARRYQEAGVDAFDVSSGGEAPPNGVLQPGNYPAYQAPMARRIKEETGLPVIAVGMLDEPEVAAAVVGTGDADLAAVGRAMLRNPYWAVDAILKTEGGRTEQAPYKRGYPLR
ncbi:MULTISPECIES: NADH:flavin oxidoreductase/NADH oxidase [unclassified Paenibacillus]|uniref:NADH:flavin oxidoreductase/NADH oxidase n=1 Tax=unclassified Paenibacillus TaxID=185978 RepID=UPI000955F0C7|nr:MULTISPECIES: NADH:flavin oxidoreductase/NADH oxidase [unclassified Paenibacillus]ASS67710.1 NADH:flavin oxidoreductase/NADH oxidase [Paenibacillus sp. RUD330]SIR67189.1 2,4-dienoyl-CoA reductase [Paenibacillus sp. RU4X]SIR75006.1 2,4-dienoyl-CoA reductase [Paenibacillus sp. RU4T]